MKTSESVRAVCMAMTVIIIMVLSFSSVIYTVFDDTEYVSENKIMEEGVLTLDIASADFDYSPSSNMSVDSTDSSSQSVVKVDIATADYEKETVYDGLTMEELSDKLNRILHSTISGQGYLFASYSMELGIDPYLAVAIVMHETGCEWECSALMQQCNNVGGMKGAGGCNGGEYASFPTLEAGIKSYMDNLYRNYFSQGLTTPEAIGPKYAASGTWASQVNAYVARIRAA